MPEILECSTVAAVPEPATSWAEDLAVAVGRRVAHYRKKRGLTAQQVSNQLKTRLGIDMKRTVLGGLESGVRKSVSVAEVLALAYILDVPPLLLLYPIGADETSETVPGHVVGTWAAAKWFTGEAPFPAHWPEEEPQRIWTDFEVDDEIAQPQLLYREHDELVARWRRRRGDLASRVVEASRTDRDEDLDRKRQAAADELYEAARPIALHRLWMRRRGLTLPPLPYGLEGLDEAVRRDHAAEPNREDG